MLHINDFEIIKVYNQFITIVTGPCTIGIATEEKGKSEIIKVMVAR